MAQRIPDLMPWIRDSDLGRSTGSAVAEAELGSVGFGRGGMAWLVMMPTMWAGAREKRAVI